MTVKCIFLATGEHIIGDVADGITFDDPVTISNPAQIIMQQTEGGRVGAAFAPYVPYAKDNKVTIQARGIVGECDIDLNLTNEYNRIFGHGIVVATADTLSQIKA